MKTPTSTARPIPRDPRTPLQRAQDQLTAARQKLIGPSLPRSERRQIADRIHDLTAEISSLES
ncbi:hypothetical protein AB0P37_11705 [Streptomyces antimycoticus]|uniref:hypothetical protein n=1 Tax=Streptomyces antimycoticus TaxID=68175 RepID=UPI0034295C53